MVLVEDDAAETEAVVKSEVDDWLKVNDVVDREELLCMVECTKAADRALLVECDAEIDIVVLDEE